MRSRQPTPRPSVAFRLLHSSWLLRRMEASQVIPPHPRIQLHQSPLSPDPAHKTSSHSGPTTPAHSAIPSCSNQEADQPHRSASIPLRRQERSTSKDPPPCAEL